MASSEPELRTEQEIIGRFQDMRRQMSSLVANLNTLDAEAAEHDLVIKQLEPMDKSRKCYRLIGDVLVERTVAETLPAVQRNRDGLGDVMKQMRSDIQRLDKAMGAFMAKYKIRFGGPADAEEEEAAAGSSKPRQQSGGGSSSKGVLA